MTSRHPRRWCSVSPGEVAILATAAPIAGARPALDPSVPDDTRPLAGGVAVMLPRWGILRGWSMRARYSRYATPLGRSPALLRGRGATVLRPSRVLLTGVCGVVVSLVVAWPAFGRQPATQSLNPPPFSFETCQAAGGQTICHGSDTYPYGYDNGVACGSAPNSFDLFDGGTESESIVLYYDADGNLTRRVLHETDDGAVSNPQTGTTAPYTLHVTITDVLTVPGSFEAGTETVTGNAGNITVPGMGAVLLNAGRIITLLPDLTLTFTAGPQGNWNYYVNGDTSVMQRLCAALGA